MGKSYKYPIFKDQPSKSGKRQANKVIRTFLKKQTKGFKGINVLHKLFCSYNISDWKFVPRNKEDLIKSSRK